MALWSELLETNPDVGLNERGHGYLKQLRASIDRMTGFLEAQLRLARVTYTQPTLEEDVDVAALMREVVGDGTPRPPPGAAPRSRSATSRRSTPTAASCASSFAI